MKKRRLKVPIFIKLLVFSCLPVIVFTSSIGFVVVDIQKKQFKEQLIQYGESLLHIMVQNAPDKFLAEEELALFKLVKDISENEQIVSAIITDHDDRIVAHSDLDQVNRVYSPPEKLRQSRVGPDGSILSTFDTGDGEYLLLTSPLTFQGTPIGKVRLVLSQSVIEKNILESKQYILISFFGIIVLALLVSLGFSIYFSRPINELKRSVEILGSGDYGHQATVHRNDEFGDLADAFNQMARDIELKEKIKDSFGRYVAPEVVELILKDPSNPWLNASLKQATVLFTDIRGFATLSENKAPKAIVDMLNAHFTQITEVIVRHGGHIDKFVGDAAMAVFGIPGETSDHAANALSAASEIMALIEKQADESPDPAAVIRIGIGINTGEMVSGNLGSKQKMEYTVIGDNVNIASRLTALAGSGEILISGRTFDRLNGSGTFQFKERGRMTIKGRKIKIRVFQLIFP